MDFEIGGNAYRTGKLNTFAQFHVGRRLGPLLGGLSSGGDKPIFQAITEALAGMSDSECNYIFHACLPVVMRQDGSAYAKVYVGGSVDASDAVVMGKLTYDDMNLQTMLQATAHVLQENIADFFSAVAAFLESMTPTTA